MGSQLNFEKFLIENQILTLDALKAAVIDAHTRKITLPQALIEPLSERELEILKLLAEGYSYKIIAARCNISYATVNTHVSHIYEKLQVKGVASAVNLAVREGLI